MTAVAILLVTKKVYNKLLNLLQTAFPDYCFFQIFKRKMKCISTSILSCKKMVFQKWSHFYFSMKKENRLSSVPHFYPH